MRRALTGTWRCAECGGRNDRADGPVCQDCGMDAQTGLSEEGREVLALLVRTHRPPRPEVDLPVSREDFLPAGGLPDDDVPF